MLAKLWKKVLLAVCIIACIFNVMSKLVNRNSLEVNLKSANDGNTVFDFTRKEGEQKTPGIVEGVKEIIEVTTNQNTTSQSKTVQNSIEEENTIVENIVLNAEDNNAEDVEEIESEEDSEKKSNGMRYQDITPFNLF
jgi:hypothetical protein